MAKTPVKKKPVATRAATSKKAKPATRKVTQQPALQDKRRVAVMVYTFVILAFVFLVVAASRYGNL